jgi:hypothetical protein
MQQIVKHPARGIQTWVNKYGMDIFRLHYSADPEKTAEWAKDEASRCTSQEFYRQEYEIDFGAMSGSLIYEMNDEYTLVDGFNVPPEWTRYFALDPHPRVPHAGLWVAMDPWNDAWVYREFWPSKVCFRYDATGKLLGAPGSVPQDDNRVTIHDWLECLKYLESKDNPENQGKDEKIYRRVLDYAARSFGQGTTDDPEQPNFQQRFISIGRDLDLNLYFEDAKKDREVGHEMVNQWLKPREVDDGGKGFVKKSRLHIMRDRCPELVYQIKNFRNANLSASQSEVKDPQFRPIQKRAHLCDDMRYFVMANPEFVVEGTRARQSSFVPSSDIGGY